MNVTRVVLNEGVCWLHKTAEGITDGPCRIGEKVLPARDMKGLLLAMALWLEGHADAADRLHRDGDFEVEYFEGPFSFVGDLPIDPTLRIIADFLAGHNMASLMVRHEDRSVDEIRQTLTAHGLLDGIPTP